MDLRDKRIGRFWHVCKMGLNRMKVLTFHQVPSLYTILQVSFMTNIVSRILLIYSADKPFLSFNINIYIEE